MTVRILIADDHKILREGLRSLLEKQSTFAVVAEAEDGLTAFESVKKHKPDIAILDIGMPGLNGIEVTRRIRSEMAADESDCVIDARGSPFRHGCLGSGSKRLLA